MIRHASFYGCQIPMRLPSIEIAARKVFEKLGVEAVDLPGYSCCPEPVISRLLDKTAWLVTSARNLALAEEQGLDIMTLCNGCYETLVETNHVLRHEPKELRKVNEILKHYGREYAGKTKVKHVIEVRPYTVIIKRLNDDGGKVYFIVDVETFESEGDRVMALNVNAGHTDFAVVDKKSEKIVAVGKFNHH